MWECESVRVWGCESVRVWVGVGECGSARVWECEGVRVWGCESVRLGEYESVRVGEWAWESGSTNNFSVNQNIPYVSDRASENSRLSTFVDRSSDLYYIYISWFNICVFVFENSIYWWMQQEIKEEATFEFPQLCGHIVQHADTSGIQFVMIFKLFSDLKSVSEQFTQLLAATTNLYKEFNMQTHRGYCLWWYPDISQT